MKGQVRVGHADVVEREANAGGLELLNAVEHLDLVADRSLFGDLGDDAPQIDFPSCSFVDEGVEQASSCGEHRRWIFRKREPCSGPPV